MANMSAAVLSVLLIAKSRKSFSGDTLEDKMEIYISYRLWSTYVIMYVHGLCNVLNK